MTIPDNDVWSDHLARMQPLELLLDRSDHLETNLRHLYSKTYIPNDPRSQVTLRLLVLSLQHAAGIRELMRSRHHQPARALFRPQVEALFRAIWVWYSVDSNWLSAFTADTSDGVVRGEPAPFPRKLGRIPEDLKSAGLDSIANMLRSFLDEREEFLHSFAHGGYRALSRVFNAPSSLDSDHFVKSVNAFGVNAVAFLSVVGDAADLVPRAQDLLNSYEDCFVHLPGIVAAESWYFSTARAGRRRAL